MEELYCYADAVVAPEKNIAGNEGDLQNNRLAIRVGGSKSLVTNPEDMAFRGYKCSFYSYFTPTNSKESNILKGQISFTDSVSSVHAHYELDTGLRAADGKPILKVYDGTLVVSTSVNSCYCILSSADVGEMSFIIFHHYSLNHNDKDCFLALAATTSAGNDDRRPVTHRMLLSREPIRDEDLSVLASFLQLNSSDIFIPKLDWEETAKSNPSYSEVMRHMREGVELQPIELYKIRENTIRTTFHDVTHLPEVKAVQLISDLRSRAFSYRYNKISHKAEDIIWNYLKEHGYYKR